MKSKKDLEVLLSKLKQIDSPNIFLEQYPTPSNIAAEILWTAFMNNEIKGKIIADLGCGNGILGIGCLLLGAKKVFFLDSDSQSILITKKNISDLNLKNYILLHKDIKDFNEKVDLVIQNPPFGIQKEHADRVFLIKAMENSKKIYSIHKIESKIFIENLASNYNFNLNQTVNFKFPLKKTQDFHSKKLHNVEVSCFILTRKF